MTAGSSVISVTLQCCQIVNVYGFTFSSRGSCAVFPPAVRREKEGFYSFITAVKCDLR